MINLLRKVKQIGNYEALAALNNRFNSICGLYGFRLSLPFHEPAVQMALLVAARS